MFTHVCRQPFRELARSPGVFSAQRAPQPSAPRAEHLPRVCGAPRPPAAVGNMGLWCLCWNKSLCRAAEGLCHPQITPEHGAESGLLSEFPPPHESPHFAVKASEGEGAPLYVSVMVVDLHL